MCVIKSMHKVHTCDLYFTLNKYTISIKYETNLYVELLIGPIDKQLNVHYIIMTYVNIYKFIAVFVHLLIKNMKM